MKKAIICIWVFLCFCAVVYAQKNYTDALSLTVVGKYTETSRPWARLDPREGMTSGEKGQAGHCAGIAVAFATNSKSIGVRVVWRKKASNGGNMGPISARGFDLYMKQEGHWLWAGNGYPKKDTPDEPHEVELISDSGNGEKHCLLYLPLFSQIESLDIVTTEDSWIEADSQPFKRRIAVWGSSYTHGSGAGRCAMTWEAQLSRATGLNFINLGFSGNCKLQPYFADALLEAPAVDAFIFDAFSNPSPEEVEERLEPFIRKFVNARPGVPLIFLQTIRREKRNFSASYDARERAKRTKAEEMMCQMVKKYPDVYWINTTNATSPSHEATSDGSHPDSYGYTLWMESVKEPIMEILAKYEINAGTADTLRILGVGNSWTRDAMRYVSAIAASAGKPVIVGHGYLGGSTLNDQLRGVSDEDYSYIHNGEAQKVHSTYQYWKYTASADPVKTPSSEVYKNGLAGVGVTLRSIVADEPWDWIVIQPEATFGGNYNSNVLSEMLLAIKRMMPERVASKVKTALMVPFAYPKGNTDYRNKFLEAYNSGKTPYDQQGWDSLYRKQYALIQETASRVCKELKMGACINVGKAIELCRSDGDLSRFGYFLQRRRDNTHLAKGMPMYVASLCYVYILLGLSPEEISFYPAVPSENGFVLSSLQAEKVKNMIFKTLMTE